MDVVQLMYSTADSTKSHFFFSGQIILIII